MSIKDQQAEAFERAKRVAREHALAEAAKRHAITERLRAIRRAREASEPSEHWPEARPGKR